MGTGDVEAVFAPLGEVLAWLYALEAAQSGRPLPPGLKHARNRSLHGDGIVLAQPRFIHGSEPGRMIPGLSMLGFATGWRWTFAALPEPSPRWRAHWLDYSEHVAGREVRQVLDAAADAVL